MKIRNIHVCPQRKKVPYSRFCTYIFLSPMFYFTLASSSCDKTMVNHFLTKYEKKKKFWRGTLLFSAFCLHVYERTKQNVFMSIYGFDKRHNSNITDISLLPYVENILKKVSAFTFILTILAKVGTMCKYSSFRKCRKILIGWN